MADDYRVTDGNTAFAFFSGVLVGIAAGLLFAPKAGREMREQLRGYARQAKENWEDVAQPTLQKAKDKSRELAQKGREFIEEKGAAVNDAIKAGREAMQSERERLASKSSS